MLKITHPAFRKYLVIIWSLFAPIHMESSQKSKLGKVGTLLRITHLACSLFAPFYMKR